VLRRYQLDQAIAACGGDAREAVKALIVANAFLETDLKKLKAACVTQACPLRSSGSSLCVAKSKGSYGEADAARRPTPRIF
jgi:hypothetical protein